MAAAESFFFVLYSMESLRIVNFFYFLVDLFQHSIIKVVFESSLPMNNERCENERRKLFAGYYIDTDSNHCSNESKPNNDVTKFYDIFAAAIVSEVIPQVSDTILYLPTS